MRAQATLMGRMIEAVVYDPAPDAVQAFEIPWRKALEVRFQYGCCCCCGGGRGGGGGCRAERRHSVRQWAGHRISMNYSRKKFLHHLLLPCEHASRGWVSACAQMRRRSAQCRATSRA